MKTTILQRKNWLLSRYSSDGLPDLYRIENVKT